MPETTEKKEPTKLQEALSNLSELTADFSSIEVLTYTGDIQSVIDKEGQGIDWDNLFTRVSTSTPGATTTSGTLKLVAATRVLFDGDTQNFRTQEPLERADELLKLHDQAVESSRQTRQALIQFFADGLKSLVKP